MNLEDLYTVLRSASLNNIGATYEVIEIWFKRCGIIDNKFLTEEHFKTSYLRLASNLEPLTLVQFIQLIGILSRHTRWEVEVFLERFRTVRDDIVEEIRSNTKPEETRLHKNKK
ncbi:hypothetical protein evm_003146 [Chilo suppressalis]|nr:hypothetical protein evm_003146 [Chilo suppressalis]